MNCIYNNLKIQVFLQYNKIMEVKKNSIFQKYFTNFYENNLNLHNLYYQNLSKNLFIKVFATFSFGGKRKRCTKEKPPSDIICLNLQQITM